jgi:hypothetical protein
MIQFLTRFELVAILAFISTEYSKSVSDSGDILRDYQGDSLTIARDGRTYNVIAYNNTVPLRRDYNYLVIPPTFYEDYIELLQN